MQAFLRAIHSRIYKKWEAISSNTQVGFINKLGAREALFSLKFLLENCYDCFMDNGKSVTMLHMRHFWTDYTWRYENNKRTTLDQK